MKMKIRNKKIRPYTLNLALFFLNLTLFLFLFPLTSQATCLTNCLQSSPYKSPSHNTTNEMTNSSIGYQSNEHRQRSHNFGDNSTAILGDVNINIGHKRIDISTTDKSEGNFIDASITSVVNVGGPSQ